MKKTTVISIILIIISFLASAYFYYQIPGDIIASHWNAAGEVNGYMSKFIGLFLFPLIILCIYLLFLLIPKIDPLKENIKKFRKYYDSFILIIMLFMTYVFGFTLAFNLGYKFNMTYAVIPAIGILFIYIGYILKFLKRNWFIGIRTPWTISSEITWGKTHNLGSVLFKISGISVLLGIFFEKYLLWFILIPTISSVIILFIYSYVVYKNIKKK
ncbi:MAG: DUF1648 domain-containing protein [Nanoarchaeota archaeon]|nr:DUF1648 domain-containing protein [Nanoarchaeota archaeon]MBU4086856.1 DUF1648 domain-containing protein [Nanoarchaeota archaeon]